jgi:hypothetical protein
VSNDSDSDVPRYMQVPFPRAADMSPVARIRRRDEPVMVYPWLIEGLGIEEVVTYLRLALWHQRSEEASVERLADELWMGSTERAERWVHALVEHDLVVTDDAYRAALKAERDEYMAETDQRQLDKQARLDNAKYLGTCWLGEWPPRESDAPPKGVAVVYCQYDVAGRLAYVGSTNHFLRRMKNHAKTMRPAPWVRWEAHECAARDEAYVLEAREIEQRQPYQNLPNPVQVGRPRASRKASAK